MPAENVSEDLAEQQNKDKLLEWRENGFYERVVVSIGCRCCSFFLSFFLSFFFSLLVGGARESIVSSSHVKSSTHTGSLNIPLYV